MSESEWLDRWRVAVAIQPERALGALRRLAIEQGAADRFPKMSSAHGGSAAPVRVFVMGSKGCGKTCFVNSFQHCTNRISSIPLGLSSHTLVTRVRIPDEDPGSPRDTQLMLLSEFHAAPTGSAVAAQLADLKQDGILGLCALVCICYSASEPV
eukprot:TRINITY_DN20251_c0_g1_i1.p3 TRINITY_DN20251_c0_g1~~TRINITY_DN20251_c0_g1_i1.p3  ORF type:complete len:154 (-),score=33.80 TRINITY_DN20251_c0_g1_i1:233-694(-)